MDNEILYSETQRFRQWWIFIVLLVADGLFIFSVFREVLITRQGREEWFTNPVLILGAIALILANFLLLSSRLDTRIKKDGIYVKFFPFHASYRYYSWANVAKSYIRQYNPVTEYGGWGLRLGLFGKGRAMNMSGNKGLQLEFNTGKRLLIGTRKPDELATTLKSIVQLKA